MQSIRSSHKSLEPEQITDNFIRAIGDEWMLITAGTPDNFNTMTASWGSVGVLWNLPVAICFIRPTRHTYHFTETQDYFTLSFFTDQHKDILSYCGSHSGKNVDKIAETGLQPMLTDNLSIGFEQSRLCLECRKIYFDDLKPAHFLMPDTDDKFYPGKDYHRMYIGEIRNAYIKSLGS